MNGSVLSCSVGPRQVQTSRIRVHGHGVWSHTHTLLDWATYVADLYAKKPTTSHRNDVDMGDKPLALVGILLMRRTH